jgi:hypothetical protein
VNLDIEWRRAVCRHLSAQISPQAPVIAALARLKPVLQALYPYEMPIQWDGLHATLQDMVNIFRLLRVEKDIYAPFFPKYGSERTNFEIFRGNQVGCVLLCTFPGLVRRYWEEVSWFEILLMPAFVELESALQG